MWEQVNSSLAFAFAGLLLAVNTAGLCAEAHAIRIQPPPGLACDQSQVELVSGRIGEVKQEPLALWVTVLTEWGTRERISLRLTSVDRTKLVSLRSPLQTADLSAWLMAQGRGRSVQIAIQSVAATALGITRAG
ncbi:MAG TPA: hypothetical protein EYF99_12000 [Pseudomonadales bacterium]|nr:hypothetical protein [Pseudomonadales bacterium]